MENYEKLLKRFAAMVTAHQLHRHAEMGYTYPGHTDIATAHIKPGAKYDKVDVGTGGRFMVDPRTGEIFGIKGYGQIHRGHPYGTLATVEDFYWGDYYPCKWGQGSDVRGSACHAPEVTDEAKAALQSAGREALS